MATRQTLIDNFLSEVNSILDDNVDSIVDNAIVNPEQIESLSKDIVDKIDDLYSELISELSDLVVENTNEELGQDNTDSGFTEDDINNAVLVGVYYVLNSLRSAFSRIHSSKIARQIIDNVVKELPSTISNKELNEAIDRAQQEAIAVSVESGKKDLEKITAAEMGFSYYLLTKLEHESRGVSYYQWATAGDEYVRPSHAVRNGSIRSWDDGDIHPSEEYGCRCDAVALTNEMAEILIESQSNASSTLGNVNKDMATIIKAKNQSGSSEGRKQFTPMNFNVKAKSSSGNPQLRIFGEIGYDNWDEDNTNNTIGAMITKLDNLGLTEDDTLDVLITSQGGSMTVGNALFSYLTSLPAKIITKVLGEASSSAFTIAMAGDERHYSSAAFSLVHNPWSCACGNHKEMSQVQTQLESAAKTMISVYSSVSGQTEEFITELMDNETIVVAAEALEYGFATHIIESAGSIDALRVDATKAMIAEQKACYSGIVKSNREETDMATNKAKEVKEVKDVTEQSTVDTGLSAKNQILQTELNALKSELATTTATIAELEANKVDNEETMAAAREEIREEVLAELKLSSELMTQATECGFKPEGSTPDEIMLSTLKDAGVENPEAYEGAQLKGVFDFAIAQRSNNEVDDTLNKDKKEASDGKVTDIYSATRNVSN